MSDTRKPIPPNPSRWQPNQDPASIHVPGLDTSASVQDQIEQIEQLITIKLQNIDENFSKVHNVLANKLLPAVKRYAVGTEPVREAAKFWTSFYEQAAQIRTPTFDDYSTVNEDPSYTEQDPQQSSAQPESSGPSRSHHYEPSMASTESSFMPGQALYSSTPATAPRHHAADPHSSFASQNSDDPSWTASMESPLVRLDRQLQMFNQDSNDPHHSSQAPSSRYEESTIIQEDRSILPRADKGKGKEAAEPLLRKVLQQNFQSTESASSSNFRNVSPLKLRPKPKTPVLKKLNPYLPPHTDPSKWNGLVDLSDPSVVTPQRGLYGKPYRPNPVTPTDDDDSFEGLPPGMSPPVLMSPARPPRSSAELGLLKLGQTPTKQAAARITRDLVSDIQRKSGASIRKLYGYGTSRTDSTMSTMPTPPSLSRYRQHEVDTSESVVLDPSLESLMRRVGLDASPPPSAGEHAPARVFAPAQEVDTPHQQSAVDDSDSFSDDEEIHNTAHPSAAFLMASQGRRSFDDSFGSSNHSDDSLPEEGLTPVHPFARGGDGDDFYDDDDLSDDDRFEGGGGDEVQEETLFGVAPARREAAQNAGGQLRMLGDDLLQDTLTRVRKGADVSPTPAAAWPGGSRS